MKTRPVNPVNPFQLAHGNVDLLLHVVLTTNHRHRTMTDPSRPSWQAAEFANPRKQTLAALLLKGPAAPGPLLTICHGFTGSKEGQGKTLDMGRYLYNALGLSILVFDFAGNGQSQGLFEEVTLSGQVGDLTAALDWAERCGFGPMLTMGRSFGGSTVICQGATDSRVAGICTWAAPADLGSLFQSFVDPQTLDRDLVRLQGQSDDLLIRRAFFDDLQAHDLCASAAEISPRPLLLIHGSRDEVVPVRDAEHLFACAGQPKQLEIVPGADHQFASARHEVWELNRAWLQQTLSRADIPRP